VLRRLRETRSQRYRLLRGFFHGGSDDPEDADVEAPRLHSVSLPEKAFAVGKSIEELGLAELGVEVSAVRRRDIKAIEPLPETRFQAGDVVVLLGRPEVLQAAEMRLLKK
jgi:CPA2 family monovalent cation:H+ antiporter-2